MLKILVRLIVVFLPWCRVVDPDVSVVSVQEKLGGCMVKDCVVIASKQMKYEIEETLIPYFLSNCLVTDGLVKYFHLPVAKKSWILFMRGPFVACHPDNKAEWETSSCGLGSAH